MTTSVTETNAAKAPKILILGATGPTGRHVVSQALARGYDVTVLVRSPGKAADLKGAKLSSGMPATRRRCARLSKAATLSSLRSARRRALSRKSPYSRPRPALLSA